MVRKRKADDLTVSVFYMGESNFSTCMKSIENQVLQPVAVDVIENVSPMIKAWEVSHLRAKTKYQLLCDADFDLYPNCIELLYRLMTSHQRNFMTKAKLIDDIFGVIGDIKLINRDLLDRHHFTYNYDSHNPEMDMMFFFRDLGYNVIDPGTVLGKHNTYGTSLECFRRFYSIPRKEPFQNISADLRDIDRAAPKFAADTLLFMKFGLIYGKKFEEIPVRDYKSDKYLYYAYKDASAAITRKKGLQYRYLCLQLLLWKHVGRIYRKAREILFRKRRKTQTKVQIRHLPPVSNDRNKFTI